MPRAAREMILPIVTSVCGRPLVRGTRRHGSLVAFVLVLYLLWGSAFGEEFQARDGASSPSAWEWVKGHGSDDALYLGMQSLHLDGTGALGNNSTNEQNDLLGLQLHGISAGTFINSHRDRAYFAGLSRTVHTKNFNKVTRMDVGYKVGILHGYEKSLPNIGGFCPLILPTIGFAYKRMGVEIGVIPVGILTATFRLNIEGLLPGSKRKSDDQR